MSETLLIYWAGARHTRRLLIGGSLSPLKTVQDPPCPGLWVWERSVWRSLRDEELNRLRDGFHPFSPPLMETRQAIELAPGDVFTHVGMWAWYEVIGLSGNPSTNTSKIIFRVIRRGSGIHLDHAISPSQQVEIQR